MTEPSLKDSEADKPWTKAEYDAMQKKAHKLGYHLITPWRKNLKNIRVGVIKNAPKELL